MTCTRCGSSDVHRSRRSGASDEVQSWFGRYPYRCANCGRRFRATGRYLDRQSAQSSSNASGAHPSGGATAYQGANAAGTSDGPEMVFRAHPAKPQAKIVVQAETHEQLNHILLTLDKAINSYGKSAKAENGRPSYASR